MKLNKMLLPIAVSVFISSGVLASSSDIKITVDGVKLNSTTSAKVINDRTLVPMRSISEAVGAKVDWDDTTKTVIVNKGTDKITIKIGSPTANINEKEITLDSPAIIENGTSLAPIRFIAESLGADVDWDGNNRTVIIRSEDNNEPLEETNEKYFGFNKEKAEITGYDIISPKNVVIPKTIGGIAVKSIKDNALTDRKLKSLVIPEGITNLGNNTFSYNHLTTLIIPKGLTTIGHNTFNGNRLKTLTIPEGVTHIGSGAFHSNQIESLKLPEGIKSIGDNAFFANKITSVTIPEGTENIGAHAFRHNRLTSVTIPKGIETLDGEIFNDNFIESVTLQQGVTLIPSGMFHNNKIASITIPDSVTTIEEGAFSKNRLRTLLIPDSVTTIESDAFMINRLTSVSVPSALDETSLKAFEDDVEIIRR